MYNRSTKKPSERIVAGSIVYLADRDRAVTNSIQLLLKTEKIITHVFDTGESLLQQVLKEPPACIVMDAIMPDIDGASLLKRMQQHALQTPVILLGGNSEIPAVVDAIKSGAWDYFEKPFLQHALIDSVRRAIALQA